MDSTSSLYSSDEECSNNYATPKKRRYKRSIFKNKSRRTQMPESISTISEVCSQTTSASIDCSSSVIDSDDADSLSSRLSSNTDSLSDRDSLVSALSLSDSEDGNSSSNMQYNSEKEETSQRNAPLFEGSEYTSRSAYTTVMLFVTKHRLTKDAFSDLLHMLHSFLPKPCKFTTSIYKLKEFLKSEFGVVNPIKHFVCETCGSSVREGEMCMKDNCRRLHAKLLVFHDLHLETQLQEFFKDENIADLVLNKTNDNNVNNCVADITDGSQYEELRSRVKLDHGHELVKNITFTMNTDGVALFSSSKKGSLWPVYLAVNELPVRLRFSKKYILTCYLFCHSEKPNMISFLSPLMEKLKRLHEEGLRVLMGNQVIIVRCHLLAVTLDLPARAMVLNMKQFNGKFGCCYCEDEGTTPENRPLLRYYPFSETFVHRTHTTMMDDARKAVIMGESVKGIKGACPLVTLNYIDLPKTFVVDWMHSVLLGVVKTLLTLWCDTANKGKPFYIGDKMALLNKRLGEIEVPGFIVRQQKNMDDFKHWKASECREWLNHYSVSVLNGIIGKEAEIHHALFVSAMFLLNKESVSRQDIEVADMFIQDFCKLFPDIYREEKQTMNIHLMRHLPYFVRLHGPLFNYSCFGFESMNNHLKNMVHGTRFVNDQICFAVCLAKNLPDFVRKEIENGTPTMQRIMHRLSPSMESVVLREGEKRTLGSKRNHVLTRTERELLGYDPESVTQLSRVQTHIGVLDCVQYRKSITKNSHIVEYTINNGAAHVKYGSIQYFLEVDNDLFAVVNAFTIIPLSLLDFTSITVNNTLAKYKRCDEILPQYRRVDTNVNSRKELVPVTHITRKCVFLKHSYMNLVSIPPNTWEHN